MGGAELSEGSENSKSVDRAQADKLSGGSKPLPSSQLTPKQFIAQKKPSNNYERVACLAYYLANYRDMPHFKTSDINKVNTESAHHFTNAAVFVMHATGRYHYLSAAGGGKKQITIHKPARKKTPRRKKTK
jgi:hypothetical protein